MRTVIDLVEEFIEGIIKTVTEVAMRRLFKVVNQGVEILQSTERTALKFHEVFTSRNYCGDFRSRLVGNMTPIKEVMKMQKILYCFSVLTVAVCLFTLSSAVAEVPQLINFQGKLTDDSGNAINAQTDVTFTIYTQSSGGEAVWTEEKSVTFTDGLFNILLGSSTPLSTDIFYGDDNYLGIKIAEDVEMAPRQQIVSVGYAYRSASVSEGAITDASISADAAIAGTKIAPDFGAQTIVTTSDITAATFNNTISSTELGYLAGVNSPIQTQFNETTSSQWITSGNNIYYDTGNVGIGTTSPLQKLYVAGDFGVRLDAPSNPLAGDLDTAGIWIDQSNDISYLFGAQVQLRNLGGYLMLNSAGNVGIGTTSPAVKLHIDAAADPAGVDVARFYNYNGGQYAAVYASDDNEYSAFYGKDEASGNYRKTWLGHESDSSKALVVDGDSGNVGIGTTNPTHKLDVYSSTSIFGEGTVGRVIISDDHHGGELGIITDSDEVIAVKIGDGSFQYGGGEPGSGNLVVDSSGNVGIGTTTPGYKLEVIGEIGLDQGDLVISSEAITHTDFAAIGFSDEIIMSTEGGEAMVIDSEGNVGIRTMHPTAKLHIDGEIKAGEGGETDVFIGFDKGYGGEKGLIDASNDKNIAVYDLTNDVYQYGGGTASNTGLFISNLSGNVGIDTANPLYKLDVNNGAIRVGEGTDVVLIAHDMGAGGEVGLIDPANDKNIAVKLDDGSGYQYGGDTGGTEGIFILSSNGNVGIGTNTPGEQLEVVGQIKITGGIPGVNKVLTSDAVGVATWQAAGTGGSGTLNHVAKWTPDGNTLGDSQIFDNGTNVGIGTTNPGALLSIGGPGEGGSFSVQGAGTGNIATFRDVAGENVFKAIGSIAGGDLLVSFGDFDDAGHANYFAIEIDKTYFMEGNVGIGTKSPDVKLHIDAAADPAGVDVARFYNYNGGQYAAVYASDDNEYSAFYGKDEASGNYRKTWLGHESDSSKALVVDGDSGNVGIGTAEPGYELDVIGEISLDQGELVISSEAITHADNAVIEFSDEIIMSTDGGEVMRLIPGGNVGIGTTSPGERLSVSGDVMIGDATWVLGTTTGDLAIQGNVGIGTKVPGYKLEIVDPNADMNQFKISSEDVSVFEVNMEPTGPGGYIKLGDIEAETYGEVFTVDHDEGTFHFMNGNVGIGTTSPSAVLDVNSDTIRLRTSKTPAPAGAAGNAGDICWDADYVYICVAANTWKRAALTTW